MAAYYNSLLGFLCLVFYFSASSAETRLNDDLRSWVGLDGSPKKEHPGAVIVFLNNSNPSPSASDMVLNPDELLSVAADMGSDPLAMFLHFDGDNLITSQPSLFNDLQTTQGPDSWFSVLNKLNDTRKGPAGGYEDLLVFESDPYHMQAQVISLCDSVYSGGKCRIVRAVKDTDVSLRLKRAVTETSTVTPSGGSTDPRTKANLPVEGMTYPAAFQLLFWTSLAIALTVYGVAYGMWHMDPGRDTIIYRMTSVQKYKKDK